MNIYAGIVESVPPVDPEVVKNMWDTREHPSGFFKPNYRGAVLIHMVLLGQDGRLVVRGMENGKPSDTLFKAISKVPMKPKNKFPPFDMNELIQLIEKEKGPDLNGLDFNNLSPEEKERLRHVQGPISDSKNHNLELGERIANLTGKL
jgi:hypothetical protein